MVLAQAPAVHSGTPPPGVRGPRHTTFVLDPYMEQDSPPSEHSRHAPNLRDIQTNLSHLRKATKKREMDEVEVEVEMEMDRLRRREAKQGAQMTKLRRALHSIAAEGGREKGRVEEEYTHQHRARSRSQHTPRQKHRTHSHSRVRENDEEENRRRELEVISYEIENLLGSVSHAHDRGDRDRDRERDHHHQRDHQRAPPRHKTPQKRFSPEKERRGEARRHEEEGVQYAHIHPPQRARSRSVGRQGMGGMVQPPHFVRPVHAEAKTPQGVAHAVPFESTPQNSPQRKSNSPEWLRNGANAAPSQPSRLPWDATSGSGGGGGGGGSSASSVRPPNSSNSSAPPPPPPPHATEHVACAVHNTPPQEKENRIQPASDAHHQAPQHHPPPPWEHPGVSPAHGVWAERSAPNAVEEKTGTEMGLLREIHDLKQELGKVHRMRETTPNGVGGGGVYPSHTADGVHEGRIPQYTPGQVQGVVPLGQEGYAEQSRSQFPLMQPAVQKGEVQQQGVTQQQGGVPVAQSVQRQQLPPFLQQGIPQQGGAPQQSVTQQQGGIPQQQQPRARVLPPYAQQQQLHVIDHSRESGDMVNNNGYFQGVM